MPVTLETLFSMSSNLALIGWLLLIVVPRRYGWLLALTGTIIPAALGVLYGGLVLANFAAAEGGGYGSLDQVRALFSLDALLLAGWVHYLAFDLAIGAVIARRADAAGLSRLVQTPILLMTFLFGPLGFLLFAVTGAGARLFSRAGHGGQEREVA